VVAADQRSGLFMPDVNTRLSAVASYSRSWTRNSAPYELLFVHDPFARIPLPEAIVNLPGARHLRPVEGRPGLYKIRTITDSVGGRDDRSDARR
jgi:hypothetical protein